MSRPWVDIHFVHLARKPHFVGLFVEKLLEQEIPQSKEGSQCKALTFKLVLSVSRCKDSVWRMLARLIAKPASHGLLATLPASSADSRLLAMRDTRFLPLISFLRHLSGRLKLSLRRGSHSNRRLLKIAHLWTRLSSQNSYYKYCAPGKAKLWWNSPRDDRCGTFHKMKPEWIQEFRDRFEAQGE